MILVSCFLPGMKAASLKYQHVFQYFLQSVFFKMLVDIDFFINEKYLDNITSGVDWPVGGKLVSGPSQNYCNLFSFICLHMDCLKISRYSMIAKISLRNFNTAMLFSKFLGPTHACSFPSLGCTFPKSINTLLTI